MLSMWRITVNNVGPAISAVLCATGVAAAQDDAPERTWQGQVFTLTDAIVGGASDVSVDRMGVIYVATFDERVYKIRSDGVPEIFASGIYGATGNTLDPLGNLYQLNFFGDYVTRIDRHGNQEFLADGLASPMGVSYHDSSLYVANCGSNSISRVTLDGNVTTFADGSLFNCPNGITYAGDGNFYVVNFSDPRLLQITPEGVATEFGTLPHIRNVISSDGGYLYVASVSGRQVHRVSLTTGEISHIAGTGEEEPKDGPALEAAFSSPNGIAATGGGRIIINDIRNPPPSSGITSPHRNASVRIIILPSLTGRLGAIHDSEGSDAMVEAYHAFRADPATAALLDEAAVNSWGRATLRLLPEAALKIFELNAESYPGSWRVYDSLGEAHLRIGRTAEAIKAFERSLEINPDNGNAVEKLAELQGRD